MHKPEKKNENYHTTTERLICPGWETFVVPVSQQGTPGRDKRGGPFVPGLATGTKGAASATWLAHPFVPVGVTNRDKRSLFFLFSFSQFFFYFNYTFAFQLNLCIWIQCVWSPLIYIVTYIIFVLDSFHIEINSLIYIYIHTHTHISIHVNSFTYENV